MNARFFLPLSVALGASPLAAGCNTAGSDWMAQPLEGELTEPPSQLEAERRAAGDPAIRRSTRTHVIGAPSDPPPNAPSDGPSVRLNAPTRQQLAGKVLGTFKNTYYDFPSEGDFAGEGVSLMNAECKPIASVARGFYESVCVQGSGTLKIGGTVSFAKRDCACAAECPRTGQRICFDLLDKKQFPWGRGAMGKAITPLLTVAVDSNVIPLGTSLYIPEYDGIARDPSGAAVHDGCFLAEDRGLKVQGQHVDVFTGYSEITKLWNRLVPSNKGVTVVLDSPRCKRAP
jgi:3D (Asp-Asp-Asp) domain-containing protein